MIIYKVVNKINGKIYIGQTIRDLDSRIRKHKYAAFKRNHNLPFHNAVARYGFDNFDFYFVDRASNIEDMNKKEEFFINKFNSLVPNGYNLDGGGKNKIIHEESKEKISKSKIGVKNYKLGLSKRKKIFCINTNTIFDSVKSASEKLNITKSGIAQCARGKLKQIKGFRFKYL